MPLVSIAGPFTNYNLGLTHRIISFVEAGGIGIAKWMDDSIASLMQDLIL